MKNTTLLLVVTGFLLSSNGNVYSEHLKGGSFMLKKDKVLHTMYKDMTLIEKDSINYEESFNKADKLIFNKKKDKSVINVIKEKSNTLQYRKEVAIDKDGTIELTVSYKLFPYKNTSDKSSSSYSLYVPLTTLEGATWKAFVGRIYGAKMIEGKITSSMPDGYVTSTGWNRFIAFKSDKVNLVFDFNPLGICSGQDYCCWGVPVGCWGIRKENGYIVFNFGFSTRFYGGVFTSKVLIYEGEYDYEKKHAHLSWHYVGGLKPSASFSFGTIKPPEGYKKADNKIYNRKEGYGWEKDGNPSIISTKSKGLINNCVFSPDGNDNAFIIDITPGYYVITLRICNKERDTGPFDVYVNGERCKENISVNKEEVKTITFAKYIRKPEKQMKIRFRGKENWSINSIVLQPLIYQTEDYAFDRGLWNVEGLFIPE